MLRYPIHTGRLCRALLGALVTLSGSVCASGAEPAPLGSHGYVMDEHVFIRMRDGVRLGSDVYRPQGIEKSPIILLRTPYGRRNGYIPYERRLKLVRLFTSHGYAFVIQDKRGRFSSEGAYAPSSRDDVDAYDTIEWLSHQGWTNGRVGMIGCSYEGDVQIFAAGTRPAALKTVIPQGSGSSVGSLNGMYRLFGARVGGAVDWAQQVGWFAGMGQNLMPHLSPDLPHEVYVANARPFDIEPAKPRIDYQRAWVHLPMTDALADQGMPSSDFAETVGKPPADPYWQQFPYMNAQYRSDVPALFVNSWYDFGADVVLAEYRHFRDHSVSAAARQSQYVLISPFTHCASESMSAPDSKVGERAVGDTTFDYWGTYLTWYDAWLKEDPAARAEITSWPHVRYFAMGVNEWRSSTDWPLKEMQERTFFLESAGHANSLIGDGKLQLDRPRKLGVDKFRYDPQNPVPSRGGAMCCTGTSDATPGAVDQRSVEMREDVLVYTSEPLTAPVDVTGEPRVVLYVSSSAIDTDFTAKLVDVQPDGTAFNVLESILRARYREGQEKEAWMAKGKRYALTIPLGATSNTFLPRHRIRLEVSSSNFPRFDRNLNVGGNNATQTQWVVAENSLHHGPDLESRLILPIIPNRSTARAASSQSGAARSSSHRLLQGR